MNSMMTDISEATIQRLCSEVRNYNIIDPAYFEKYSIKRGLRNADGTGVMAGLTNVCNVEGYYIDDGERVPREGRLKFRGIDMSKVVAGCEAEHRYGYEEIAWLLLFGSLPNREDLAMFTALLAKYRELPEDFIEDMIMKAPSPNIMNKMARSILALYSFDENPDDTSVENVMRQCIQILAKMPAIMAYAYQVKRRHYDHESMFIHQIDPEHTTAQAVLGSIRADRQFTEDEALLLDTCLMVHAEHGGGNNSTFANRVLTSSGTDTYSAVAAGIGALKGPRHGGANIKSTEMINFIKAGVADTANEGQVADFLAKLIRREAGDGSGLIYGMGHAVYTLSDPRAVILKARAAQVAKGTEFEEDFNLISTVERLTPEVFKKVKGSDKDICANVDLYSGLIYRMLRIPEELFTPIFSVARVAGWSAHRVEELLTGGRIIRPAYKSVVHSADYIPLADRD